jgi:hypothetical protein
MGRDSTGAWTTDECLRIELSYLLKTKYLVRGRITTGSLAWRYNGNPSGTINILSSWLTGEGQRPYIRLTYTTTDRATGVKEDRDDTVYLEARPSNLGKGEVLYFICPSSGQRCRILYKAYGSRIWKSRTAYQNRIYYPTQKSSKRNISNDRYWQLESQIDKLTGKRRPGTYRGKLTKRALRLKRLEFWQDEADYMRFRPEAYPLSLRKALFSDLPGFGVADKG